MSMNQPSLRGAVDLSALTRRTNPAAASGAPGAPGTATPSSNPLIFDATDANFSSVLELSRQVPVVVDLWAEWCGPCKQLTPVLEKVVTEFAGRVVLAKVDVDANPQLAQAFQAQSIPTVAAIVAGQPVPMFTGAIPEEQVREIVAQLVEVAAQNGVSGQVPVDAAAAQEPAGAPVPPRHEEAFDAIEKGDYASAIAAYEKALVENPKDADARAGLAQVKLLERLSGATLDEIRQAAAMNPDDLDAQMRVADLDVSGGHVEDAFGRLLDLFAAADSEQRPRIRERLIDLFEVVGPEDPRVISARTRLANLLF